LIIAQNNQKIVYILIFITSRLVRFGDPGDKFGYPSDFDHILNFITNITTTL